MSIKKAYNSWAESYDTNENKTRDLDQKSTIKILSKYSFETVLELGCGTGKNTQWHLGKATNIIGLDFSQEMLNKAKEKINNNKVLFIKADLLQPWDVQNEFADLVTSSLTLEHIKNIDFIFKQACLKLKPNGLFFINELHPFKQYTGSKARFETEKGTQVLEVYTHHISEYIQSAKNNGFVLVEIDEQFDQIDENEIPRLISFVFKKNKGVV
ncbi:MAG: methyltransferase domain-containing protein [Lutibacter sp.]|uniref:class I SAM-dependent DNA methyltransferase n=1 Tax=Lutibacter sp. TaxID=1925666 RepID=UPI0017D10F60|nr:class I SAM-dependent methyltransferase [Lutibacter sp.]MBT8317150.1 methyltransferase domain-containing protein [Lutibacter sp.]NNJ58010.1 methyltransferase domain-containing protein [Lutibacter sp.]